MGNSMPSELMPERVTVQEVCITTNLLSVSFTLATVYYLEKGEVIPLPFVFLYFVVVLGVNLEYLFHRLRDLTARRKTKRGKCVCDGQRDVKVETTDEDDEGEDIDEGEDEDKGEDERGAERESASRKTSSRRGASAKVNLFRLRVDRRVHLFWIILTMMGRRFWERVGQRKKMCDKTHLTRSYQNGKGG
jgi:hypothetical protein